MSDLTMVNDVQMPEIKVRSSGVIVLNRFVDERDGVLCIAEAMRDLPFNVKRVYYVSHLESAHSVRGMHAHRTLWQAIFCINGSFMLELDDGEFKQDVLMWQSHVGVLLGPGLWHTMRNFSSGCVFLVFASDYYDASDYIRDYATFQSAFGGLK